MSNTQPLNERKTPEELGDLLKQRGYTKRGEGNFSAVYQKPGSNTVLKVGTNEDSWDIYARLCRANQNNPHFPKIEKIGVIRPAHMYGTGFLVARMESLEKIDEATLIRDYTPMLCFIGMYITKSFSNRTNHWEYAYLHQRFISANPMARQDPTLFLTWANQQMMKCPKPLAQALMTINRIEMSGVEFDFKPDNFMLRRDGTLVITDPVWRDF